MSLIVALTAALALSSGATSEPVAETIYAFSVPNIDGKDTPLKKYEGKVLLVVNVASRCGLTPQYEGLEALYRKYSDQGLVVLGFPANNFNGQEPGTNEEIKAFCTGTYDVTFPMFSKISVNGPDRAPIYRWLIAQSGQEKDIEWNFAKFLVGRDGKTVKRFEPGVKPDSEAFILEVERILNASLSL